MCVCARVRVVVHVSVDCVIKENHMPTWRISLINPPEAKSNLESDTPTKPPQRLYIITMLISLPH